MLLDTDDRTVTGSLSDLLTVTYAVVMGLLTERPGLSIPEADAIARGLLPRLDQALVTTGFVTRPIRQEGIDA